MDSFEEEESIETFNDEVIATIYMSDEECLELIDKEVIVDGISADTILTQLKNLNVVSKETKINSFATLSSDDNNTIGIIDFSSDFYDFNLGSGFESMMLDSVARTYIENFNLSKLKILVDGDEYQSGHILFGEDDYFTIDDFN
jgi:hypothetical protein